MPNQKYPNEIRHYTERWGFVDMTAIQQVEILKNAILASSLNHPELHFLDIGDAQLMAEDVYWYLVDEGILND